MHLAYSVRNGGTGNGGAPAVYADSLDQTCALCVWIMVSRPPGAGAGHRYGWRWRLKTVHQGCPDHGGHVVDAGG